MPPAAPQGEGGHGGSFRGELQPAGVGQAEAAGDFPHHAGQTGVVQAFLHALQHPCRLAGLGVDHPVRMQADAGQTGGEQVGMLHRPQHRATQPNQQAGDEQRGGRTVLHVRAGAHNLVQRAQRQAAFRQAGVDRRQQRQRGSAAGMRAALDAGDARTQGMQGLRLGVCLVHLSTRPSFGGQEHIKNYRDEFESQIRQPGSLPDGLKFDLNQCTALPPVAQFPR